MHYVCFFRLPEQNTKDWLVKQQTFISSGSGGQEDLILGEGPLLGLERSSHSVLTWNFFSGDLCLFFLKGLNHIMT